MSSSPSLFLDRENTFLSIFSYPFNILNNSIWSPLNLLVSGVVKPYSFRHISELISPSFCIILVALVCTLSSISISFLRYILHACIQYSKWGLTIVLYGGIIRSSSLYTIFRLTNPRIWFPFTAAVSVILLIQKHHVIINGFYDLYFHSIFQYVQVLT